MEKWGIKEHEEIGATFLLQKGFSNRLVRLVESHVAAKRYLTFKRPEYYDRLSEASKATLEFQGGKMSDQEAAQFEASPLFEKMIQLRLWDDQAKIESMELPDLSFYKHLIIKHLIRNRDAEHQNGSV